MGNYSWLRADKYTERSNIACGDTYKFLVPKEFGGGYVRDVYHGCGCIFDKNYGCIVDRCEEHHIDRYYEDLNGNRYPINYFIENDSVDIDIYAILAWWNVPHKVKEFYSTNCVNMIDIMSNGSTHIYDIGLLGLELCVQDDNRIKLKYPLKMVSDEYVGTYEDCVGVSLNDPEQGCNPTYWDGRNPYADEEDDWNW